MSLETDAVPTTEIEEPSNAASDGNGGSDTDGNDAGDGDDGSGFPILPVAGALGAAVVGGGAVILTKSKSDTKVK